MKVSFPPRPAVTLPLVVLLLSGSMYSEPLYVGDGYAIHPGPNGIISGVARGDIDTIEVLKDPADTARYGLRVANGVIVIKTKLACRSDGAKGQ